MTLSRFEYNNAKAIYIVDYQLFDVVIDLGFRITIRKRIQIESTIQDVPYHLYGKTKRILSDLVHGRQVKLTTKKSPMYEIWSGTVEIDGININKLYDQNVKELIESYTKRDVK